MKNPKSTNRKARSRGALAGKMVAGWDERSKKMTMTVSMTIKEHQALKFRISQAERQERAALRKMRHAQSDTKDIWQRNDLLVAENAALHTHLQELGHPYDFGVK